MPDMMGWVLLIDILSKDARNAEQRHPRRLMETGFRRGMKRFAGRVGRVFRKA